MKNKFPKQLMLYSLILTAVLFTFLFACSKSSDVKNKEELNANASMNSAASSTVQHHTMAEFLEVTQEYQTKRWDVINQKMGIEDAKSIWFSLDRLKNFINGIQKNSAALNI